MSKSWMDVNKNNGNEKLFDNLKDIEEITASRKVTI